MEGKVAIVTGGSSGIGKATAELFASRGVKVVIADTACDAGNSTAQSIREDGGDAVYLETDVSQPAQVEALTHHAVDRYGRIDIAFNNAGINRGTPQSFHETPDEEWNRILSINLGGVRNCMKYELEQMLRQGTGGCIVNTSSIWGVVGFAGYSPYVTSKHAISGLTRATALEYIKSGIRINSIHPGPIDTAMPQQLFDEIPEAKEAIESSVPIGRMGQAREVANAVAWLCSDAASYVVGHALMVDGGYVAQ